MSREGSRSALRLAVTPRWLAFAGLTLFLVVVAVLLGRWQWDKTQTILEAERASASQAIPLDQALPIGTNELPGEVIGQPVTLNGTYEPALQVAVVNRELAGNPGVWIVTALRLADGRLAPVLRGWLASVDEGAARVPSGPVTVTGVLQPDEAFYADAASAPGTVASIASDRLAKLWGEPLLPGYVLLTSELPARDAAPAPVPATVQTGDVPFPLQNFVYAFQWWLFALFAIVIFVRWLLMESKEQENRDGQGGDLRNGDRAATDGASD
jgi:cytochrome oxidase assembly protein ShyY1